MYPKNGIFYALFLAVLFVFVNGYEFNGGDHAEHLPQIYRLFDPELYPHDFFLTNVDKTFDLRAPFVWTVYPLAKIFGLAEVCFVLTLFFLWLSVFAVMRLTRALGGNAFAQIIAPFLVFFVTLNFTIGGNRIAEPLLVSTTFAQALALWATALFFEKKYESAFLWLGFASIYQILVGGQLFILFVSVLIINKTPIRILLKLSVVYALICSPIAIPIFLRQFSANAGYDSTFAEIILYGFRCQLHYLPSLFPLKDYLRFGFLTLLAGFSYYYFPIKSRKEIFYFITSGFLCLIFYTLLLEGVKFHPIGKSQFFKITIWFQTLFCIFISINIQKFIRSGANLNIYSKLFRYFSIILSLALLFVIFNSAYWGDFFGEKYKIGNYKKNNRTRLHEWIARHTPKNAIILTGPDDYAFPCQARRSTPIGYKAMIFEPFYILEWYERYKLFYSINYDTLKNRSSLRLAAENYEKYYVSPEILPKFDYRINNLSLCKYKNKLGAVVRREGDYALIKNEPRP